MAIRGSCLNRGALHSDLARVSRLMKHWGGEMSMAISYRKDVSAKGPIGVFRLGADVR